MVTHYGVTLTAFAFAMLAAGCGDSRSNLSPASASSLSDASASASSASGSNTASSGGQPQQAKVEIRGDVAGLAGSCPSLTFTINGTAVTTNSSTQFEDGPCSGIQNGTGLEVEGVQQPDGSLAANEVEIEDVELAGLVSALAGSCPNLTFMVNGTSVETNSSTRFDAGRCSDIQNGEKIEVEGLRQPNGSVLAQNIEVDEGHHGEVELKGLVSGLGGACPAITFIVNGVAVATNSSTEFDDGPCGGVQNGSNVEVKGIRQADGSVVAREVEMEDFEVEGTVSGLSGTCPNLTFVVNGTTVVTNSVSKFDDGPCTGVQNGLRVEVEGLRQSNGSLLAHKVELDDD